VTVVAPGGRRATETRRTEAPSGLSPRKAQSAVRGVGIASGAWNLMI
jgi:hypothetical protein